MTRFRNTLHQEGQSQNQRIWKSKDLKDVRKKKPTCLNMISPPKKNKKTKAKTKIQEHDYDLDFQHHISWSFLCSKV
jgi:hypothetical protein